jgi:hypothetical protein
MTVLLAHVEDDWTEFPNNETRVFEDSEEGFNRAVNFVESSIPWEENHMKIYFKNCSKTIGEESRIILAKRIKREGSVTDWNCKEKFPAKFSFCIKQVEVE